MPKEGEKRYNLPALIKLAEVLGLEFYFGPPRDTGPVEQITLNGADYAQIPLFDAMLSAGPGAQNHGANIASHLAFRRDWLGRIGVPASSACLARITGDSMCPTIHPGDMVLIDRNRTEPPVLKRSPTDKRRPQVYAFVEEGEARIKRIERPEPEALILLSDNPEHAPQLRTGAQAKAMQLAIIGKVIWWGHTDRE
ncbi:MAG: S24 family peptidase [Paracoccaceae bacterium]|nr:S24 family peptidase [Paracoccaceae bacterium]